MSESEGEWSLPTAATPGQEERQEDVTVGQAVAAVVEMSERVMKHWLQRFADDGDVEALTWQWRVWTENDPGAGPRAVAWLVHRGLDDCKCAAPATAVLERLLKQESLAKEVVEVSLAAFSPEDIEDMALDNPKVGEFVAALRTVLASCSGEDAQAAALPAPSNGSATRYPVQLLLAARRAVLRGAAGVSTSQEPRWRTEAAARVSGPVPRWEEERARREQREAERPRSSTAEAASCEWRRELRKSGELRPERGSDARGRRPTGQQKEALQTSETSWAAQLKRRRAEKARLDEAMAEDEDFVRELRLALNKLTVEKFDRLSDSIIQLVARSARPNRGVPTLMQLVFEKATTQHHFINMYVDLCVKLHAWFSQNEDLVAVELQGSFRRILLNQCQNSFEQYLDPPEGFDGLQGAELYEAQVKYKTRMLGNIRLVGELIGHGMLQPEIAIAVARELAAEDPGVREERLETLAVFLETVGPSLDHPGWAKHAELDAVFVEVGRLVDDSTVSRRTRCLLRDVLDKRESGWQACKVRDREREVPATIAQVHQRAVQGQQQARGSGAGPFCRPGLGEPKRRVGGSGSVREPVAAYVGTSPASSSHPSPQLRAAPGPGLQAQAASATRATSGRGAAAPVAEAVVPEEVPQRSRAEMLVCFHKEVARTLRQVGSGADVLELAQSLRRGCPLPPGCSQDEAADLIARIVDEPRTRRQAMLPLLPALFAAGVFSPPDSLGRAVEAFARDAFADPDDTDPPDLADIVLGELLPALALAPSALDLPPCLRG